jgi:hypothetical protein
MGVLRRVFGGLVVSGLVTAALVVPATASAATAASLPQAPTVSSRDYPSDGPADGSGGTGIPGGFRFSAGHDSGVTGFYYGSPVANTYVAAGRHGGSAVVRYAPSGVGPADLRVVSVDAAGDRSAVTDYQFVVRANRPTLSCPTGDIYLGQTVTCTVTPYPGEVHGPNGTIGYTYQLEYGLDGGPVTSGTLPVDSHGRAHLTFTPTSYADYAADVLVRAQLRNGNLGGSASVLLGIDIGLPTVDQSAKEVPVGTPVVFTVQAELPNSVSLTYTWEDQDPVTVPVGPDGTTTITLVADETGVDSLFVQSVTATGTVSGPTEDDIIADPS